MFKKLAKKLALDRQKQTNLAINPLSVDFGDRKSHFLSKLTETAVNMYERKHDVEKFSKLVLSDLEDDSHNQIMNELFKKGVADPFEDEKLFELSDNSRLLRDLGLLD